MAAVVVAPPPVPLATAVERSDVFARKLVAAIADFAPEGLAQMGVIDTKDEAIVDLGWAVEGFIGSAGKLQLTNITIPNLSGSSPGD